MQTVEEGKMVLIFWFFGFNLIDAESFLLKPLLLFQKSHTQNEINYNKFGFGWFLFKFK